MKGFRTFLLGLVTVTLGLVAPHLPPATVAAWGGVVVGAVGVGIIVLRIVTDSPIFARLAKDVGMSEASLDHLHEVLADVVLSPEAFQEALDGLNDAVKKLEGHPLLQPETVSALTQLVTAMDGSTPGVSPALVPAGTAPAGTPTAVSAVLKPAAILPAAGGAPEPPSASVPLLHT